MPESEKGLYEAVIPNPVLVVPDFVKGLGKLRNWVMDHFDDETIVMIDDDILTMYCLTGARTRRISSPEEVVQIIINTAVMAHDLGVHVFGFSQTDIRKFNGCDPFSLTGWVGCVIGIIGRKYRFRDDPFKVDIDMCLQNMLVDRIIWMDTRYTFPQFRDNNVGGNSAFRTKEGFEKSVASLKKKWKGAISVRSLQNQIRIKINVGRKQSVKI